MASPSPGWPNGGKHRLSYINCIGWPWWEMHHPSYPGDGAASCASPLGRPGCPSSLDNEFQRISAHPRKKLSQGHIVGPVLCSGGGSPKLDRLQPPGIRATHSSRARHPHWVPVTRHKKGNGLKAPSPCCRQSPSSLFPSPASPSPPPHPPSQ